MERKGSIVGVILLLIGVTLLIIAIAPLARANILLNESRAIQGSNYYYVMYDFDEAPAMHMKFTVSKGYTINFWVLDETNFNSFKGGRSFEYYSYPSRKSASSSEINWTPPDNQKTYFVWDNPNPSSRTVYMLFSSGGGSYLSDWAKVAVGGFGCSLLIGGILEFRTTVMQKTTKRPDGIIYLCIMWGIFSVFNIYQSLNGIIGGLGFLPDLSDPSTPEWIKFGLPAEIMLNFFLLAFGFLTLIVAYGLWTARSWSYRSALATPVLITILNIVSLGLYASAPPELEFEVFSIIPFIVMNLIALVWVWGYLTRPDTRQYLNQTVTPLTVQEPVPSPPIELYHEEPEEMKFCRYCGAETKTDAVFCEKCGKKIG